MQRAPTSLGSGFEGCRKQPSSLECQGLQPQNQSNDKSNSPSKALFSVGESQHVSWHWKTTPEYGAFHILDYLALHTFSICYSEFDLSHSNIRKMNEVFCGQRYSADTLCDRITGAELNTHPASLMSKQARYVRKGIILKQASCDHQKL